MKKITGVFACHHSHPVDFVRESQVLLRNTLKFPPPTYSLQKKSVTLFFPRDLLAFCTSIIRFFTISYVALRPVPNAKAMPLGSLSRNVGNTTKYDALTFLYLL